MAGVPSGLLCQVRITSAEEEVTLPVPVLTFMSTSV
jgi:hypothetical protein